nr:hypothetical protein [Tanacetum cinerariifolium]
MALLMALRGVADELLLTVAEFLMDLLMATELPMDLLMALRKVFDGFQRFVDLLLIV